MIISHENLIFVLNDSQYFLQGLLGQSPTDVEKNAASHLHNFKWLQFLAVFGN